MKFRAVSDRVTVIRRGKSIGTVTIEGSTNADSGRNDGWPSGFLQDRNSSNPKEVVLLLKICVNENRGIPAVRKSVIRCSCW